MTDEEDKDMSERFARKAKVYATETISDDSDFCKVYNAFLNGEFSGWRSARLYYNQDKCKSCTHCNYGGSYDEECVTCREYYGSHYEERK